MKLLITAATAALLTTAAIADQSTRYNDLRLDTSETAETVYSDETRQTDIDRAQRGRDQRQSTADDQYTPDATYSSRSVLSSPGQGYPYGGYGPGNDSR